MTSTAKPGFAFFAFGALALQACVLVGVEPDEIDLAAGTDAGSTEQGDGDSDSLPGGDGDGDPTGDGDDTTDPNASLPCDDLEPLTLAEGVNDIEVPDVMSSFEGSCGAPGPDVLFSFVAEVEGTYEFVLTNADFDGVFYLVGPTCLPLDELDCKGLDDGTLYPMQPGEVLYVIVDSHDGPGLASLTISKI